MSGTVVDSCDTAETKETNCLLLWDVHSSRSRRQRVNSVCYMVYYNMRGKKIKQRVRSVGGKFQFKMRLSGTSLAIQWLGLCTSTERNLVWSLVGKLTSHKSPHATTTKKKPKTKQTNPKNGMVKETSLGRQYLNKNKRERKKSTGKSY